jgi:predicted nucleic acid-binding Zn ribbon protein
MRRPAPRPIAAALEGYTREAAPATLLARVQASWPEVAGEVIAAEAHPASERAGTVTFSCSSGVWANELDLLSGDLRDRLNAALEGDAAERVRALRFRVL